MTVRLYEWDKTETGWAWIEITDNKVVNLILRELDNLIKINDNNEVYTDLQLEDWIDTSDSLPIWLNVGRALQADWRPVTWTLITGKTTSWDEVKVLYWDDGKIRVDNGNGIWKILAYEYEAGEWISIDEETRDDYSAMRWPCPEWFHIPTNAEMNRFVDYIWRSARTWTAVHDYFDVPYAWWIDWNTWTLEWAWTNISLWTCTRYSATSAYLYSISDDSQESSTRGTYTPNACPIRPFADEYVEPIGSDWVEVRWAFTYTAYKNTNLWLISIPDIWITMADKNVWATNVWDTWYYFQWWNNYGFTPWQLTTSTTRVDASWYWPWNYYSSSTFIKVLNDRSTVRNDNLWWASTWVRQYDVNVISNPWVLSVNWQTGHVTLDLDLWTAAYVDTGTNPWDVPVIWSDGKIDASLVSYVSSVYTVTNVSDLVTITNAVKWDFAVVTSESTTYILSNEPYSTASNWVELLTPTTAVSSVNWMTWAVTLTTNDVSEYNNKLYTNALEKATWNAKLWTNDVATVAISGNYSDLNNLPTITDSLYLTQAQYDALPSTKLTDWNSYFICA